VRSYREALTAQGARYLIARGVDRATADTHQLGVAVDPHPGHERFQGMLSIPYLDRDGRPLSVRFRCLEEHDHREHFHGKYNSVKGDPARVFNVGAIHRAEDEIHVTEGEFDAMVLTRVGYHAVAIPGAQAWRGHHRRMLAGFSRVYVWGDPDDAGAEFVQKVTRALRNAKGVRLRDGDVTDTFLAGGAEALHGLINRKESAA
jgi:DNA primase